MKPTAIQFHPAGNSHLGGWDVKRRDYFNSLFWGCTTEPSGVSIRLCTLCSLLSEYGSIVMMITANVSEIFYGTSSILRALHSHNTSNDSEANIIVIISIYTKNTEVVGGYLHPLERELNWKRPEFELLLITLCNTNCHPHGAPFPTSLKAKNLGKKIFNVCSTFMIL